MLNIKSLALAFVLGTAAITSMGAIVDQAAMAQAAGGRGGGSGGGGGGAGGDPTDDGAVRAVINRVQAPPSRGQRFVRSGRDTACHQAGLTGARTHQRCQTF
jgi:hypothetical protein